ncbi:hypothetical protein PUNSTDRAFT_56561 [Punctularia strigosozonata HHB-11173 SS5]|uniref:uncharacterized protein n=1 Tax=Punctularia strigosozonata (strain HHB-11173) TaxID=741275 RepID=UPI00044168E5|nr:uncharacterized protein PUNSTDRAFT_56561 [Punctularia strigosozonata HHB-11173 SS5]EIN13955.1 hypothetical protein PUNSTDRAFT_56561 [Punctularia strigosozonata HHB-11173 SS5]
MLCRIFPINDLPNEILVEIFRFACWHPGGPSNSTNQRLWLTWVCRRWRAVALTDMTIWNDICFRDSWPFTRSLAWLERAGSAPLDLRICEQQAVTQASQHARLDAARMSNLMDRIMTKVAQIRVFIASVDDWDPALIILDRFRKTSTCPTLLERFELYRVGRPLAWIGPGYQPAELRQAMPLCGGTAPSLRHLTLAGIHVDWTGSSLHNLTSLDLRRIALNASPDIACFRIILRSSPELRQLTLYGAGPRWPDEPEHDAEPIVLEKLNVLTLGELHPAYAAFITKHIRGPNTRILTIANMTGHDYGPFVLALVGLFPDVRSLTIRAFDMPDTPHHKTLMAKWMASMPLLGYLRVAVKNTSWLDLLCDDPCRYDPQRRYRAVLGCRLRVLDWQEVDPRNALLFARRRKQLGVPLTKLYINPCTIGRLGAFWRTLQAEGAAFARDGVWPAAFGARMAPEELSLLTETSPLVRGR